LAETDLTRALTVMIETLPKRLDESVDEQAIAECLDLFSLEDLLDRPETRSSIRGIRDRLALTLAKLIRERDGVQYERYETGMWSCLKCDNVTLTAMVVQEKPNVVMIHCGECKFQSRKTILDEELAELRHEGTPLDPFGRHMEKRTRKAKRKRGARS